VIDFRIVDECVDRDVIVGLILEYFKDLFGTNVGLLGFNLRGQGLSSLSGERFFIASI